MPFARRATVVGIACLVYSGSVILHESGHAASAAALGGNPTLISTTDVLGDWSGMSVLALTIVGLSGFLVNLILALLGLVGLRSRFFTSGGATFLCWLLLAVNGFIAGTYMIVSPLFGFGDWSTIIRQFDWQLGLRSLTATIGLLLTLLCYRLTSRHIDAVVGREPLKKRILLGQQLALTSWLTSGTLGLSAALLSPLGASWAIPIALGSTMGTTWPMLPAALAGAGKVPGERAASAKPLQANVAWIGAGLIAAGIFIFGFGPGIRL